jgi:hypothetical protein
VPGWYYAPQAYSRVSNIDFVIWICGLEVQNPTKKLKSVKGPYKTFDLNPKWEKLCRPLAIFHGIFIALPKKMTFN